MTTEVFAGSEAISTTEWSLPRDASYSSASPQTADGRYQVWLDLSDMVAGDELQIRVYEKVQSADTQRIGYQSILVGPQSPALWLSPPFPLMHGWDVTLDAIVGTVTVTWSIRQLDASAELTAIKVVTDALPNAGALTSLATQSSVNTIDDFLDTEVAAIKAVTDAIPNAGALTTIQADLDDLQTRIGAAGAGLTAIPWNAAWDAEVQSEAADALNAYDPPTNAEMEARTLAFASYATAVELADVETLVGALIGDVDAILDDTSELQTDWVNGGRLDVILDSAASSGDPWETPLPGAYASGQAGKIVGDNVNATILSRATPAQVNAEADTALSDAGVTTTVTGRIDVPLSTLATQASVTTIDDFLDAEVAAILAAVDTEIAAIKAKTDLIPGTIDGKTFSELVTLMAAALLGKASGLATTTAVYRAIDDSKARITATVDAVGNRSAVTMDAT